MRRRLTPEDFYVFLIAHAKKHYSGSGTGFRTLMDVYVCVTKMKPDLSAVRQELEKLGIADFEEEIRSLAMSLFEGGECAEENRDMLDYVFESGTYGTMLHKVENSMGRNNVGKIGYSMKRLFGSLDPKSKDYLTHKETYPFFYKHKIFLPVLPLYRIVRGIRNGNLQKVVWALKNSKKKG